MSTPAGTGDTVTPRPDRARWSEVGAPLLAVVTVVALSLGVLLGWLVFGERSPGDTSADAGFARDMSEHHAQAVEMSLLVMERTDDEDVRRLARDIATTQSNQQGRMAAWLQDWGLPMARPGERMDWMDGHGEHTAVPAGAPMPGMATPQEIDQLTDAEGEQAEVLFLQLMTTHHLAGVEMAEAAVDLAAEQPLIALAQGMADAQESEIGLMTDMLADRGAEPREDVSALLDAGPGDGAEHTGGH